MTEKVKATEEAILDFRTDMSTVKRSAVHSIAIQLLFRLKGFITLPIMTHCLSPAEFGAFNLIIVTSSMLVPLFSLNLTDGPAIHLVQEQSKSRIVDMYNTVTNVVLLSSLLFLPLYWLIMWKYGGSFHNYSLLVMLVLYSNIFYKVTTYVLTIFQKTALLLKNTMLRDGAATVLSVVLVVAGYSFMGWIVALVLTNVAAGALVYRITRRELKYSFAIDKGILLQFLGTALPLLPVFFFTWIVQSSATYFLAYFKGQEAVGKYSVIFGYTNVILSLTFALNFFWFPISARLWVKDREKYRRAFKVIFAGFTTALFVIVALFELNSKLIMELLVRRHTYHDAYVITGIIAFAFAMQVLITLLTAPLYSNRNTKTIFTVYLCGGVINTVLNFLLIPLTGIIGAAISTAVSYLLIVLLMSCMNYRVARFAFFDNRLLPITVLFALTWAGVALVRDWMHTYQLALLNLVLLTAVGFLLYAKFLRREEKAYLANMYSGLRSGVKPQI